MLTTIMDGVDQIIDRHLQIQDIGTEPHHKHLTAALRLANGAPEAFDAAAMFDRVLERVDANFSAAPRWHKKGPSSENWRWTKRLHISAGNRNPETQLEKRIAAVTGNDWANQVPVASGLVSDVSDKKRAVDLAHRTRPDAFELIELKWASDNPLFAAMELLGYAAVYVVSRRRYPKHIIDRNARLAARSVELTVLAPRPYYMRTPLAWLEDALNKAFKSVDGVEMSFRYQSFPEDFDWPCDDPTLRAALAERQAVSW